MTCFGTKNIGINEPILQYPDFTKIFNSTTYVRIEGLGAVVSQGPNGKDLPKTYASRTLNDTEVNYYFIKKELLASV